ncbi:MAG: HAD family hydrolase [Desulfotalea sp.]
MKIVSYTPGRIRALLKDESEYQRLMKKLTLHFGNNVKMSFSLRTLRALFVLTSPVDNPGFIDILESTVLTRTEMLPMVPPYCPLSEKKSRQPRFLTWDPIKIILKETSIFLFLRWFAPLPFRILSAVYLVTPVLLRGVKSLKKFKFDHDLLDACSMVLSVAYGNLRLVNTVGFLVHLNEQLEGWSNKQNVKKLEGMARQLLQDKSSVFVEENGIERSILAREIERGDSVVCRGGNRLVIDGYVLSGEAFLDESMTNGCATPARKVVGAKVFAGSYIISGEIVVCCEQNAIKTKLMQVTERIWQSEIQQPLAHSKAEYLANKLARISFVTSALIFAVTRNAQLASLALMVDYSCVLKLLIPFSYQSGLLETAKQNIHIRGSATLEKLAKIETVIVRDTGVLTTTVPQVDSFFVAQGHSEDSVIAKIACLEEHFVHRLSKAIVNYAAEINVQHEELHGKVNYVNDHGLVAYYDQKRLVVGNRHFLEDDENVDLTDSDQFSHHHRQMGHELSYIAENGVCIAAISIKEVFRQELWCFLKQLKQLNVDVLFCSDRGKSTRENVTRKTGIKYLPSSHKDASLDLLQGRNVALIGDHYRDEDLAKNADIVAMMPHKSMVLQRGCDIMMNNDTLLDFTNALWVARSTEARVGKTAKWALAGNLSLLAFGISRLLNPAWISVCHNALTAAACVCSLKPLDSRGRGYCKCKDSQLEPLVISET